MANSPLKVLTGFLRVDGVSQVALGEKGLNVKIVLSRLRDDFSDPYHRDARLNIPTTVLTLTPGWLRKLTIGSIWKDGALHSKPEPHPSLFTVDTTQAVSYPFNLAVKVGGAWTETSIAAADFIPKTHYQDIYASLYTLVPTIGDPIYKWLVIPNSEFLRFYMGVSDRLLKAVLRGETSTFITWPSENESSPRHGRVEIYEKEKTRLKKLEALVFARALASDTFRKEMLGTNQRIITQLNSNPHPANKPALNIETKFPFKGVTNLTVAGQAMQLANDKAFFVMEMHYCTFPLEFTQIKINGVGNKKSAGTDEPLKPLHQHFTTPEEDPDDEVDEISDEDTDARLKRLEHPHHSFPFAGSSEIKIEYNRAGNSSSSLTTTKIDEEYKGKSMGDGDYKNMSQGLVGVDNFDINYPPAPNLLEFLEVMQEFRIHPKHEGWSCKSISINEEMYIEVENKIKKTSDETPKLKHKEIITFFNILPGRKKKWHLIQQDGIVRPRQIACIEVRSSKMLDGYFYLLELELKDGEGGQCTAILRSNNFQKLSKEDFNEYLALTFHLKHWPDFIRDKWSAKKLKSATKLSQKIVVTKFIHPSNRELWARKLSGHIRRWLKNTTISNQ